MALACVITVTKLKLKLRKLKLCYSMLKSLETLLKLA